MFKKIFFSIHRSPNSRPAPESPIPPQDELDFVLSRDGDPVELGQVVVQLREALEAPPVVGWEEPRDVIAGEELGPPADADAWPRE